MYIFNINGNYCVRPMCEHLKNTHGELKGADVVADNRDNSRSNLKKK